MNKNKENPINNILFGKVTLKVFLACWSGQFGSTWCGEAIHLLAVLYQTGPPPCSPPLLLLDFSKSNHTQSKGLLVLSLTVISMFLKLK